MTIKEYLHHKYSSLGLAGYEAELEEVMVLGSLNPDATLDSSTMRRAERAFVERIPELLLHPSSVSELGVSISRAGVDSLKAYYSTKCKQLGIKDVLTESSKVRIY